MTSNVLEFIAVNFFDNMDINYTCSCGLYVHPTQRKWWALHNEDCVYYIEPFYKTIKPVKGLPPDMASDKHKYLDGPHEHIWEECLDCDAYIDFHRADGTHNRCSICGESDYDY